jgi:hypothetical protein
MKAPSREYFTIAAAMLAILLCGYGIGFIIGERTTQKRLARAAPPAQEAAHWEAVTLDRLSTELKLTPEQRAQVKQEIAATAQDITKARAQAIADYQKALLDLHQRVLPHLTDAQKQRVEESRRRLKETLDKGESLPHTPRGD